jgi:nitroimidazol reductase NimA-like FMN-containing flavoprotein (pyridoxamine 5'-phosphate oxidase superfamily)
MGVEESEMKDPVQIKKQLNELLDSQRFGVLSTHHRGQPYASLIAFYATEDLKHIYFATTRSTRKYANLVANARAALLVDSRTNQDLDISNAVAATATGKTEEVEAEEKENLLKLYLRKHPQLKEFATSPTCALLRIKVDTYYFVNRFQEVFELHITE